MKKKYLVALVVVLLLALVGGLTACAVTVADASEGTFVAEESVTIAHITDTHYYPLAYCYGSSDITKTDYEGKIISGTKPMPENHLLNVESMKQILKQKPDYIVVTGDLTYDGEVQSHIEMSNLLRDLQNKIRAASGNEDFQIFVNFGNHDLYNPNPQSFRNNGDSEIVTRAVTREDARIIYAGLGYPNITKEDFEAYYQTLEFVYEDRLPYTPDEGTTNYIHSENAGTINFTYQWEDETIEYDNPIGKNGSLTFVAECTTNNYTFVSIDEEISDNEIGHHVGGNLYKGTRVFLNGLKENAVFEGRHVFGLTHHNLVPHFKGEDQILKDFTIYGWKENLDFFTDLGIQYNFSGHMHANDIATASAFNGKRLTDIETASTIGYEGGARYCKIEHGKIGSATASQLHTKIDLIKQIDLTEIIDGGYINKHYRDTLKLDQFIKEKDGKKICDNPSQYLANNILLNIIDVIKASYINPDSLMKLIDGLEETIQELGDGGGIMGMLSPILNVAKPLILNIVDHLENVALKDYVYNGSDVRYQGEGRFKKLCGFLDDLVDKVLLIPVADDLSFFDFVMGGYMGHLGGDDVPYEDLSDSKKEALENLYNGKVIKELFNALLDKETGLYKIVEGLTLPMDLVKGLSDDEISALEVIFSLLNPSVDLHKLVLDDVVPQGLELAAAFGIDFSLDGKTIMQFVDNTMDGYITESFYTSLGEIAGDIMYNFLVDETGHLEISFNDEYVLYKYDVDLAATHSSAAPKEEPSIENGKLPSMLTVTFGEDPTTDKNFVWFTDPRIMGTDIQYMEGTFDEAKAIEVSGTYKLYETTTPAIDLGIFATLQYVNTARHSVKLTGLKSNTTYEYRVGSAVDGYWSPVYKFKTAPSEKDHSFELLLMTDIQGSSRYAYEAASKIMNKADSVFENGYDFVINCGDVVDNSKNDIQWRYFLDIMQENWGNTTQVVATGNHSKYAYETPNRDKLKDRIKTYTLMYEGGYSDTYNYEAELHYEIDAPEQDRSTGVYYSFDYSGVHFTVLNTNDVTKEKGLSKEQVDWLIEDLSGTELKHKIVIMHKGIYTTGSHNADKEVERMRKQLTPIFAENGVSVVLQGHDHTYSESYYLDANGNPVENNAKEKNKIGSEGTLYITLGTMGEKYYNYVENDQVPIARGKNLHNPTLSKSTFGKLTFDGEDLYYQGYEYDAEKDTVSEIKDKKLETWEIAVIVVVSVLVAGAIAAFAASFAKKNKVKKSKQKE